MPLIMPITDLRKTKEISKLCHKNSDPIFITKDGYGDLVVMSIETYEKHFALSDIYKKLNKAEEELKNHDSLLDAEDVFKNLRKNFG